MATTKVTTDVTGLNSDTTPLAWAKGTTAERPTGTISHGFLRENTTTNKMEVWTDYSGLDMFKSLNDTGLSTSINYLVVAGGGGASNGGGGAGGLLTGTTSIQIGNAVDLNVGLGGTGANTQGNNEGTRGGNSKLNTIEATGGGGGLRQYWYASSGGSGITTQKDGGSGGGGAYNADAGNCDWHGDGIAGQGNDGAGGTYGSSYGGGGGGGAAAVGSPGTCSSGGGTGGGACTACGAAGNPGNGGSGSVNTIISTTLASSYNVGEVVGANVYYAGGGAGGWKNDVSTGTGASGGLGGGASTPSWSSGTVDGLDGTANTGGGGSGPAEKGYPSATGIGGDGGSGVVIIKATGIVSADFSAGCTVNGTAGAQTTNGDTSTGNSIFVVTVAGASDTVTFN